MDGSQFKIHKAMASDPEDWHPSNDQTASLSLMPLQDTQQKNN
jgi:hypothetical protein